MVVTVLESCRVFPPAEGKAEKRLPLTFFDLIWIPFHPLNRVIFFDFPCSTDHFIQNIVPNLKTSLSHALQHFFPLAGNLIRPSNSNTETDFHIRYVDGDSVSVTFAECTDDFNHFCGYEARAADLLRPLVSELPKGVACVHQASGEKCFASPLLAVQVTLFPNHGVCFGFTNSHVVADGSSLFSFIRAWASLAKQVMSKEDGSNFQIPCYDRSSILDPLGLGAQFKSSFGGSAVAEQMEEKFQDKSESDTKARVTFVLKQADIEALKSLVIQKRPSLPYVSSITVTCAYVWTCMAKTRAAVVKNLEQEPLNFGIAYDCRARLDPPLPASYFGNCILSSVAAEKKDILAGEEGLFTAAELIGKSLSAKLNNKEGVYKCASNFEEFAGIMRGEWYIGVAGSPKIDYYNTIDFGWGKPRKFEFVSEPFSISRCKDSKVDLELGFIMPNNEVDVFSAIFAQGLTVPA